MKLILWTKHRRIEFTLQLTSVDLDAEREKYAASFRAIITEPVNKP
jgi:hypothetical protein